MQTAAISYKISNLHYSIYGLCLILFIWYFILNAVMVYILFTLCIFNLANDPYIWLTFHPPIGSLLTAFNLINRYMPKHAQIKYSDASRKLKNAQNLANFKYLAFNFTR